MKQQVFTVPQSILYKKRSFNKTFLLMLFVVMGTTLFSCKNHNGQTVGEIAIEDDSSNRESDTLATDVLVGKAKNNQSDSGKVHLPPPPPKKVESKFVKPEDWKEIELNGVTVGMILPEIHDEQIDSIHGNIKSNN
ncbi:hypothetical protein [Flavobacterium sp. H122]|uniref:hypothetical protein n=1 Tax=Flavobacterium sp. H122 TaxID=2529860 RepID=UPI0010A9CEB3|nr:hypothetical protein [Flavobacterium sp. H122]